MTTWKCEVSGQIVKDEEKEAHLMAHQSITGRRCKLTRASVEESGGDLKKDKGHKL